MKVKGLNYHHPTQRLDDTATRYRVELIVRKLARRQKREYDRDRRDRREAA